jgi:hypothetical protein
MTDTPTRHGAAIACTIAAAPRPSYDDAVKHRPRGACYCDLDDRACYAAGHWQAEPAQRTLADEEPRCEWQAAHDHCKIVRCTNCPHYNSGLRN